MFLRLCISDDNLAVRNHRVCHNYWLQAQSPKKLAQQQQIKSAPVGYF